MDGGVRGFEKEKVSDLMNRNIIGKGTQYAGW